MKELPVIQHEHHHDGCCDHDHERVPLDQPLSSREVFANFGIGALKGLVLNVEPHAHSFKEGYKGFSTDKGSAYLVAAGTLVAGVTQTVTSFLAGSPAGITGGLHDTGDVISLWDKMKNTNPDHNSDRDQSKRRAIRARRIAFGGAAIAATYSGVKLYGFDIGSNNESESINQLQTWVTVGVLAVNSAIAVKPFRSAFQEIRKYGNVGGHEANELKDHLFADIVNSVGSVSAAVLALRGQHLVGESIGAGLAGLNAWRFQPYWVNERLKALNKP